jgi:uncharacterized protein
MSELGIVGYECTKCGKVHYPFHDRCMECKGREFNEIKPEGNPSLVTFTQIFNLPWGFDQRFIVFGVVAFDNGIKAMGHIKVNSIDNLKLGMRLKADWEPVKVVHGEKTYGLTLEPLK